MLKTILEYVLCYSAAFFLGLGLGVALGFYVREQWNAYYED